ncbi:MAG: DMT family transporter [Candidatus Daviesbacteria bacterium]|nr:DMT family transporter [Candidatus Daviesbacteria bacterium]
MTDLFSKYRYHLALLVAGFSFSFLGVFSVLLTAQGVDLFSQIFYRVLFSAIFSAFFAVVVFKQKLILNLRESKYILINSLAFLGGVTTFSTGIFLGTPIAKAIALNYAYPLTIMALSFWFFKDRPTLKGWAAIVLSLISVWFMLEIWSISSLAVIDKGSILEFANSFFFGFMIVFGRKMRLDLDIHPFRVMFFTFAFLVLEFWVMAFLLNILGITLFKPAINLELKIESWISLVGISFLGSIVPLALIYFCANKVKAHVSSVLLLSEPFWGYILGLILFGQVLTIWGLLGMIGIVLSVLLVE